MKLICFPAAALFLLIAMTSAIAQANPAVSYTSLSDAARKAGKLARYENAPCKTGAIKLGNCNLDYSVPETASAYDVIPIRYTLHQPPGERRAAVEAVAFEDPDKTGDNPLYDLAIPGDMGLKIEYLGSVTADFDHESYVPLTADPETPVSPFPPYKRDAMVRSSTIRAGNGVWFKFRITNTGDTVFDPEGFGASFAEPVLRKLDKDGNELWSAKTLNGFERQLDYLYPGDSSEQWINFYTPKLGGQYCRGLSEGTYRVDFRMVYRYHREYNWGINIWTGKEFATLEVPINVTAEGSQTPVEPEFKMTDTEEKMPGDYDAFEEFMTSLRIYQGVTSRSEHKDTIYLQVAPWTRNVVLKLILTDPKEIAVARVPINITDDTLQINCNPDNVMVVEKHGRYEPAIIAMAMPGMRTGFPLGPYPEEHMLANLQEMKDLGVNVISNTAGSWWIPELSGREGVELHSACYKYFYDVLMRKVGLKVLGWCVYPPSSTSWYDNASALLGREVKYSTAGRGYGSRRTTVDMADPIVPEVIAAWAIYNYKRWGDMWFHTKDCRIPIEMEDTWGWMRDDINVRHYLGPLSLQRFRDWLKGKYGNIDAVNAVWGSDYGSFDDIDPQADQGTEGFNLPHEPVYNKPDHVFHDWNAAVEDWDTFRTQLRMDVLRKANEIIQKTIPSGEVAVRTEGANLVIRGDGESENMHMRHVYYSQRRNAMVYDVVKDADVLHFYSDYTTMPYTEQEWRQAMRQMVSAGVIPMFLPQFDHMRDILLNPHYGREYQMHYNLDDPSKGMMVHCLAAAYPMWKATYEEGGAPGIIWSDYNCDGFATQTQKRELRLLRDYFNKMDRNKMENQKANDIRFETDNPNHAKFFERLRKRVQRDSRSVCDNQRSVRTNPAWLRDHIHEMKAYKWWESDLCSYIDRIIELQPERGFFHEILCDARDPHLTFSTPEFMYQEESSHVGYVRLEIEADIEYLMAEAVYTIWQATGDDAAMARRLPAIERGLMYMLQDTTRWDEEHGLVKRAFTIDTWDFTYTHHPDTRWIAPDMPMCIMHGDNSGMYQACLQASEMREALGDKKAAAKWREIADGIRTRANDLLWTGRFYQHQYHLDEVDTGCDERQMLSLSNTYDINRGMPDHKMAVSIIDEYRSRREANPDDVGEWYSLDPPYPKFSIYTPGKYINGGVGGFVAGELAKAAFQHGRENYGADILRRFRELCDTRERIPFLMYRDGSDFNDFGIGGGPAGWTAAAVLSAMVEGLAGITDLGTLYSDVEIAPRYPAAGIKKAHVSLPYGPSDAGITTDYLHDPAAGTIEIKLTGSPQNARFHMLMPEGKSPAKAQVNGVEQEFSVQKMEDSVYCDFQVSRDGAQETVALVTYK